MVRFQETTKPKNTVMLRVTNYILETLASMPGTQLQGGLNLESERRVSWGTHEGSISSALLFQQIWHSSCLDSRARNRALTAPSPSPFLHPLPQVVVFPQPAVLL
jgi:hypothetical protein